MGEDQNARTPMAIMPSLIIITAIAVILAGAARWGMTDRRPIGRRLLTGLIIAPLVLVVLYLAVVALLVWGSRHGNF